MFGLDVVQLVLVGIGIAIAVSIFLKNDKKDNTETKVEPKPEVPVNVPVTVHEDKDGHDFLCLVEKWYSVKSCAHELGLHDVCKVLDDQVFPLLNTKREAEPENDPEPDEVMPL